MFLREVCGSKTCVRIKSPEGATVNFRLLHWNMTNPRPSCSRNTAANEMEGTAQRRLSVRGVMHTACTNATTWYALTCRRFYEWRQPPLRQGARLTQDEKPECASGEEKWRWRPAGNRFPKPPE